MISAGPSGRCQRAARTACSAGGVQPDRPAAEKGFSSERAIRFGGPTTDEMMLAFLNYTHTEPIDFEAHPELIATAALPDPGAQVDVGE